MQDWYPNRLPDLGPWHQNFDVQVQATGLAYGLSAANKLQAAQDAADVFALLNHSEIATAYFHAMIEFKKFMLGSKLGAPMPPIPTPPAALVLGIASLPGIGARTRLYAGIIKADADYTKSVGEQYRIIAPDSVAAGIPKVMCRALPASQVRLRIGKAGFAVLAVDSRRGGGDWEQIGVSQLARFDDVRPSFETGQPEVREYRVQGMLQNHRVGSLSQVVTTVTTP